MNRNNFGVVPYEIQKEPFSLKICKALKKGGVRKSYDLLLENYPFSELKDKGISKTSSS